MKSVKRITTFIFFSGIFISLATSQNNLLQQNINYTSEEIYFNTILENFNWLEQNYNINLSYSTSFIDADKPVFLVKKLYTLEEFLLLLLSDYNIKLIVRGQNKILILPQVNADDQIVFHLTGFIKDYITGEAIIGAILYDVRTNHKVVTNESGYYKLSVKSGMTSIEINYLGYKPQFINIEITEDSRRNIALEFNNELPPILISSHRERVNDWTTGDNLEIFKNRDFKSLLGESDIINNARVIPGVQSGGEGQSGIYVRGGGNDQNLVVFEGIALYETSHTAGISSMFIEESIKEASFMKNGFPARYGGRLSSVMDIHLKEGSQTKHEKVLSLGMPGAKVHLNGPLYKDKTTYNISGRVSWINSYINAILLDFTSYDEIKIDYYDFTGKITHRFSESNKLSLSFYSGGDQLNLRKSSNIDTLTAGYFFRSFDQNRLRWKNTVTSLKWDFLINSKINLHFQAGMLAYQHRSRSSYYFETQINEQKRVDELDILSYSDILDKNLKTTVDYFLSANHTLKFGVENIWHRFNPTVKQSLLILEGEEANILDQDSILSATEFNFFVEDNFKLGEKISLNTGFNLSRFNSGSKAYYSFQPRINFNWRPNEIHNFTLALTKMTQNLHLLVNSGLGLPSDLWVPSTENILPQNAWQYSAGYGIGLKNDIFISFGAFIKNFTNIIEYNAPIDLFYFFINQEEIVPTYNTSRDWERNVEVGKGNARGLEFLLHRKNQIANGWLSFSYSKNTRTFANLNNGQPFPYKYDRTIDVNIGTSYYFSENFSLGMNFVYGTGNTFSLATEEFNSVLGLTLLNAGERNNYRLPDFHQLGLNAHYTTMLKGDIKFNIDFNVYNVYNRLNAYFIYIYKNPITQDNVLRKVSILPITPSINFSISF